MDEARELSWLRRVRELAQRVGEEPALDRLLPAILDAAIELTRAERGYLVRVEVGAERTTVRVVAARGFDGETMRGSRRDVSQTVVERVLERDTDGLVTTREEDADVLDVTSVAERRVRSIACVPMRLRGEVLGVLYLDHRFTTDAFIPEDLPYLRVFADQAALALETAELASDRARVTAHLREAREELKQLQRLTEAPLVVEDRPGALRFGGLVGGSPAMSRLFAQIEQGARSWAPVLIVGESGTGKEQVARELHRRGSHPQAPFLSESCASLADPQREGLLFGQVAGPAGPARDGLLRQAGRGTLLLDEVGELPPSLQARLLRVLQEGEVRPLGSDQAYPVLCRVLAATRYDLRALVAAGGFREDLFYRLDVLRIDVPPLRARQEDVPILIEHFGAQEGRPLALTPRALHLLVSYTWPGNVRELRNEVRRLCALGARELSAQQLSPEVREGRGVSQALGGLSGKTLAEVEREMVQGALASCQGNKAQAARQLGVPRSTLYSLIKRHGLED
ncbi:MAG: sigma 54-interacting transcriptional regulator [Planctomycetota bacterium]